MPHRVPLVFPSLPTGAPGNVKPSEEIAHHLQVMQEQAERLKARAQQWRDHPTDQWGLSTGLTQLDNLSGGLPADELVVLAGGPGSGKTALWTQALEVSAEGLPADALNIVLSCEMSQRSLYLRWAARRARLNTNDLRRGNATQAQLMRFNDELAEIVKLPILVLARSMTSQQVLDVVRMVRDSGRTIGVVGIDYVQLLQDEGPDLNVRMTNIMRNLVEVKNEGECNVLILSQYSRRKEWESFANGKRVDREPQLSDLRDSGSIEQSADQVWMLHDPLEHQQWTPQLPDVRLPYPANRKKLFVRKNRNGAVGEVSLYYTPELTLFASRDEMDALEREYQTSRRKELAI